MRTVPGQMMKRGTVTNTYHIPVLLNEVFEFLDVKAGDWYVDATAGGGGHTQKILDAGGKVIAIDRDEDAHSYLTSKFKKEIELGTLKLIRGNFADLDLLVKDQGDISGILFDLGLATRQLRNSGRGFSFLGEAKLDMRMDRTKELTAAEVVNKFSKDQLYEIFRKLGEEHLARPAAAAVVRARAIGEIETTTQLAEIIAEVYDRAGVQSGINPATKVFQALRIYVNDELNALKQAIPKALDLLNRGGRLVLISYHSLEDRIVKQMFQDAQKSNIFQILTKKPITATEAEIRQNPASRSAKLRAILKN